MHWLSIVFIGMASNIDNLGIGVSFGARSKRIPFLSNLFIAIIAMAATYASITMGHLLSNFLPKQSAELLGGLLIVGLGVWSMKPYAAIKFWIKKGAVGSSIGVGVSVEAGIGAGVEDGTDLGEREKKSEEGSIERIEQAGKQLEEQVENRVNEVQGNNETTTEFHAPIPSLIDVQPAMQSRTDYVISWKETVPLGLALSLNCMATGFGAGVSGVHPLLMVLSVGIFSMVSVAFGVGIGQQIAKTWLGRYSSILGGLLLVAIGLYEIFI